MALSLYGSGLLTGFIFKNFLKDGNCTLPKALNPYRISVNNFWQWFMGRPARRWGAIYVYVHNLFLGERGDRLLTEVARDKSFRDR